MAQRIVGLEIGTSAIRAAELTVDEGSRPILEAFGQVGIPPGVVVDGEIRNRQIVVEAIHRLRSEGGFSERRVVIGIAGLRVITRELDMPMLPEEELREAVKFQADQVVPFPLERTSISSKVIAQYTDAEGAATVRVLVAAAHRDLIDEVVTTAEEAGLEPVAIDLNTAALVRALADTEFPQPEVLVSVGAGLTLVVVHQAGVLQFVRTIDLGGNSVTAAIAGALDLPVMDAEGIKRRLGQGQGAPDPRATSATRDAVSELVTEIHNSIRFFTSLPGRSPVARVLVTGGGSQTLGFLEALQSGLDVPVLPASPVEQVDASRLSLSPVDLANINPTLAVPLGLALPDRTGEQFNLLPPEIAAGQLQKRAFRFALLGAGLVIALLLVVSGLRLLAIHNDQNDVNTLKANIADIQNVQIPKYDVSLRVHNELVAAQAQLEPLISQEVNVLVVFNQLGLYIPPRSSIYPQGSGQSFATNEWFSTVTLTAGTTVTGSAPTPASTSSLPDPDAVIGSGTGNGTVQGYQGATDLGESMSESPVIVNFEEPGPVTPGTTGLAPVGVAFEINGHARTQRMYLFTGAPQSSGGPP
jgi:type IV pilus assembly protein PilM